MDLRQTVSRRWGGILLVVAAGLVGSTRVGEAGEASPGPAIAQQAPAALVADDARLAANAGMTRFSVRLSGSPDIQAFALADPDRVVVELPQTDFQIDPAVGRRIAAPPVVAPHGRGKASIKLAEAPPLAGVVNSFRFGQFAPGKSRIVIDLAAPARIARAQVETGPDGERRLIVELAREDRAAFLAEAVKKPAPPPESPLAAAPAGQGDKPVVVIDAGHGGIDDGAHAPAGALEKTIVLDFAHALAEQIESRGRYRVVLTRSTDIFIPLGDRVKIAQDAGASLFISIHADTLSDEPNVSGATVYTVADKASDAVAARVAEKENQSDAVAGVNDGEDKSEVADILYDLTRRETRAYSHVFAGTLVDYFKEVGRLNKNARRSAGFRVLKAPDIPSVLLELGYLSSAKDEPNLVSAEWRGRIAGAVANAVDRFFASRVTQAGGAPKPGPDESRLELKASFDAAGQEAAPR